MTTAARFDDIYMTYPGARAGGVQGITFDLPEGKFITLLGPSGSGKTTILRLLAGFLRPDSGQIFLSDSVVATSDDMVPTNKRDIAMVFQSYALWPHLSVFDNVAFGLRARKVPKAQIESRVTDALAMVGLETFRDRLPGALSGGQQQRVALARSVILRPKLLLLDEPLSNLDAELRMQMRRELKDLQEKTGITFVYVTHDQEEALAVSDYILVLSHGQILQQGPPEALYLEPDDVSVAKFLRRSGTAILGRRGDDAEAFATLEVTSSDGTATMLKASPHGHTEAGQAAALLVRAESLSLVDRPQDTDPATCRLAGEVQSLTFTGRENLVEVRLDAGTTSVVYDPSRRAYEPGDRVVLEYDPADARIVADAPESDAGATRPIDDATGESDHHRGAQAIQDYEYS